MFDRIDPISLYVMLYSFSVSILILFMVVIYEQYRKNVLRKKIIDTSDRAINNFLSNIAGTGDQNSPGRSYIHDVETLNNLEGLFLIYQQLLEKFPSKQFEDVLEKKFKDLEKRIINLEHKLSGAGAVERNIRMNNLITMSKLETLTDSVDDIRNRVLGKWDVALVVFLVISAVIFITTVTYTAISYFLGLIS